MSVRRLPSTVSVVPELPDVEGFRKVLASCAKNQTIRRVDVRDTGVLHGIGTRGLRGALEDRSFAEPERRGKWLLARTGDDGPTLMLHFGMTGMLLCGDPDDPPAAHDRVLFALENGRVLRYRDQRKLQGLWLAEDEGDVARLLGDQGPDALSVGRAEFEDALASRRGRRLKTALTDQSVVAGLGNLLADEILWRARLRPDRRMRDLTEGDRARLHADMRRTLHAAVKAGCVPSRDSWLTGHRDDAVPICPRCGTHLCRSRIAGRGTVWCPHCQSDAS
jgi:formamidopyrimidine-DNA glycosylase